MRGRVFDTNKVGGALGLGNDFKFDQDIYGAKLQRGRRRGLRPRMVPAIAVGAQYKRSLDAPIVAAVGARARERRRLLCRPRPSCS